ncbi:MarR family transcriptional regulator [Parafrankia sp. FMc6]|uniref:MarR family winged helix-turn-helix transcriptional regulator n=1 Tax=Parafrankia soli TaxID=2599596 RepID=UPI0034D68474
MTTNEQNSPDTSQSLTAQVIEALPDWITHLIQLNSLIAARMGVVVTDFHCLHALQQDGPTTAGALAERVGLTPGSASRMIDRLAAAGCVRRVPDPRSRRRIIIEPTDEGLDQINAYYSGLTARTREDLAAFNDDELHTLLRFIEVFRLSALAEVRQLRSTP